MKNNIILNNLKNVVNINEPIGRLLSSKKKKTNINEVNSERDYIFMSKKSNGPIISTTKQEN